MTLRYCSVFLFFTSLLRDEVYNSYENMDKLFEFAMETKMYKLVFEILLKILEFVNVLLFIQLS